MVDDGAVGLALQRIAVDPHGAERHGVKRLYGAIGQAHEDHALGVGGVVDGEAGAVIHSAGGQHLTGYGVHLIQRGAGVGVQAVIHQNGTAAGICAVALTQLGGPAQHGLLIRRRHRRVHHAVVAPVCPEGGPCGVQHLLFTGNAGQADGNHRIGIRRRIVCGDTGAAMAGDGVAVRHAGHQAPHVIAGRGDTLAAAGVRQEHRGVGGVGGKGHVHRLLLADGDGIDRWDSGAVRPADADRHRLAVLGRIQCCLHTGKAVVPDAVHLRRIAAAHKGTGNGQRRQALGYGDGIGRVLAAERAERTGGVAQAQLLPVGTEGHGLELRPADEVQRMLLVILHTGDGLGKAHGHGPAVVAGGHALSHHDGAAGVTDGILDDNGRRPPGGGLVIVGGRRIAGDHCGLHIQALLVVGNGIGQGALGG